jgi:hypothetical protein
MEDNKSSITIKENREITNKNKSRSFGSDEKTKQEFTIKIYTDKTGVLAVKELRDIKALFDYDEGDKKEIPLSFTS